MVGVLEAVLRLLPLPVAGGLIVLGLVPAVAGAWLRGQYRDRLDAVRAVQPRIRRLRARPRGGRLVRRLRRETGTRRLGTALVALPWLAFWVSWVTEAIRLLDRAWVRDQLQRSFGGVPVPLSAIVFLLWSTLLGLAAHAGVRRGAERGSDRGWAVAARAAGPILVLAGLTVSLVDRFGYDLATAVCSVGLPGLGLIGLAIGQDWLRPASRPAGPAVMPTRVWSAGLESTPAPGRPVLPAGAPPVLAARAMTSTSAAEKTPGIGEGWRPLRGLGGPVLPGTAGGAVLPGAPGGAVLPGAAGGAVLPGAAGGAVLPGAATALAPATAGPGLPTEPRVRLGVRAARWLAARQHARSIGPSDGAGHPLQLRGDPAGRLIGPSDGAGHPLSAVAPTARPAGPPWSTMTPAVQPLTGRDPRRLGDYQVLGRIGAGGMALVLHATSRSGQEVAIKVPAPSGMDEQLVRRLRAEMTALRRLDVPGVVRIREYADAGGWAFIAMDYLRGPTLDAAVARVGPFDGDLLRGYAVRTARALAGMHRAGVTHRDIKPRNVILTDAGPVLVDLGIARLADAATHLTVTGSVIGSAGYLPPEAHRGHAGDHTADVWGWACCVAFAASGRPLFPGASVIEITQAVLAGRPDLDVLAVLHRADPLVAGLVRSAIAPVPSHRPSTGAELLAALPAAGAWPAVPLN